MKFGFNLTAEYGLDSIVEKAAEVERLGFDSLWIFERPGWDYGSIVASALAANTKEIRIGLGVSPLLHTSKQIADEILTLIKTYGERFDLCLIPGDKRHLRRLGVNPTARKAAPQRILQAKREIEKLLAGEERSCSIWLGAQGPRMLRTAQHYRGVHLNYASPRMITWALEHIGSTGEKREFEVSVMAPSYVYRNFEERLQHLLKLAASSVAVSAPREVLEEFGLYDRLAELRGYEGRLSELDPASLPPEVVEFSLSMHSTELPSYLAVVQGLGINHLIFSHPQDYSLKTIHELASSLPLNSKNDTH
ncbi:MAG: LLM class flavin-dependent oxidoreductase [Candidatus Bathyarchaeia archaeon]